VDKPLTPHELRIAEMAMNGMTNREIASKFDVTSRTIELHLTRIYRKLAIRRRTQLATALNRR
jgi:DNA-binding NarL/FixJ family response regulator